MAIDENTLSTRFDIAKLSVLQSSQIADRTSKIVSKLTAATSVGGKPMLICLTARSKAASKLISIVEIARRELKARNVKCYQYNMLTSELGEVPREPKKSDEDAVNVDEDSDDADAAFETMGAPKGSTKKRNVALMKIYLSSQPVKELRNQHGEQS